MRSWPLTAFAAIAIVAAPGVATAQSSFTLYELLDPETHSFRITYDTTASRAGDTFYLNPVRTGSVVSDERVIDRATGLDLEWDLVTGAEAKSAGLLPERAADEGEYLRIRLARPVPEGGEARIRIYKTYRDPESYSARNGRIVFDRGLGIRANAVVLPADYELVASRTPGMVSTLPDGRIKVSFLNDRDDTLSVRVEGRALGSAR